jgi:hypothetical protein
MARTPRTLRRRSRSKPRRTLQLGELPRATPVLPPLDADFPAAPTPPPAPPATDPVVDPAFDPSARRSP